MNERNELNSLPEIDPPPALWSAIRGELDRRRASRRNSRILMLAVAAAIVLALAPLFFGQPDPSLPGIDQPVAAGEVDELVKARALSALLEAELRQRRHGTVSARSLESLLWLETELAWLDARLADQPSDLDLWRQRIELLSELNRHHYSDHWHAEVQATTL